MRQDPGPLPFLEEALTIAKFEPGMYEVVRTCSPFTENPPSCNTTVGQQLQRIAR